MCDGCSCLAITLFFALAVLGKIALEIRIEHMKGKKR